MEARALVLLAAMLSVVACSNSKDGRTASLAGEPAELGAKTPDEPVDLSNVEIGLKRTMCYGWCPSYSVVISGTGHVQYVGEAYVRELGDREATLPLETVRELLGQFEKIHFMDLQSAYRQPVTDCPSTFLTFRTGDRSKCVQNYWARGSSDVPGVVVPDLTIHEQLDALADAIDKAVNVERWIGTQEERRAAAGVPPRGSPDRVESK